MIGPGHLSDSQEKRARSRPWRVAVVTGSRAEFGLLRPVMKAVEAHTDLELLCIASGSHLIQPAETFHEVKASFPIADSIPMQIAGKTGRVEDAEAVARGVGRFTRSFDRLAVDWVVVLGDRIEAFAAASAAAIGGWPLAHIHGGDRAEGIADESIRHAITKLAHVHFPATQGSGDRIIRMGEKPENVHVVGSPAMDDLPDMPALSDQEYKELGSPTIVYLMHPVGRHPEMEEAAARTVLGAFTGERVLALHPNFDAGREGIVRAIESFKVPTRRQLQRPQFVGLLKRLAQDGGVLVGNSSSALIEAAALRLPIIDIGPRQAGRERANNALHAMETEESVRAALLHARRLDRASITHPYGDGRAGYRVADVLARLTPSDSGIRRKLCAY